MTLYLTPYRRMAALRQAMDRMFEENFADQDERELMLAVDVRGDDESYTIQALVPGLKAEDLSLEILNNTVTIRGEFKNQPDGQDNYLLSELPNGRFSRVLTLPTPIESAKVEASIKDGVLNLHLPKAEAHRPKAIKINAK